MLHFWDFRGEDYPGVEQNETLDYIISTNADIVNLQEYDVLDTKGPWKIKEAQIDSLNALYPYQYTDLDLKYALLSKYQNWQCSDSDSTYKVMKSTSSTSI